ncbi:MAG: 1-acyl-sn-glycerol-3-phosphate acyltransferase [Deltaproteobacteria bacterium]|nr:1-acyl-sn-glycerol-3-phosphate acyltransferase [Deltaproteobacteria bacterium]
MSAHSATGMFTEAPPEAVAAEMERRVRRFLAELTEEALASILEEAHYLERKRVELHPEPEVEPLLDALAEALLKRDREAREAAALALTRRWAEEIHGAFSTSVYRFATRVLPTGVAGLIVPSPRRLRDWRPPSLEGALQVDGDFPFLQELAREATLILAPTHVSNMDSPLIGLALYQAGLPPFRYGAGLNLFSNPVMSFFMSRLGAYTVDRTKSSRLYKQVLKEYSVRLLTTRQHSLFFPGGTRSRSGGLERDVKKGLLGTGLTAWQENLEANRPQGEIYVVPMTLTYTLVLEAETLIRDHLAEAGKQRFIISDDEFARPSKVFSFARRLLELDGGVVARLGEPLDLFGNKVARSRHERGEQASHRMGFVTDRGGKVVRDPQRDRVYTERLSRALTAAYPGLTTVTSNHLVARVAWRALEEREGTTDPFRLVRTPAWRRVVSREELITRLRAAMGVAEEGAAAHRWHTRLPSTAEEALSEALTAFRRFHHSRALADKGNVLRIDNPNLCYYYQNRLQHLGV